MQEEVCRVLTLVGAVFESSKLITEGGFSNFHGCALWAP